jgi:hypothetical protein
MMLWRNFFRHGALDGRDVETTFNATLCLFRGMGLQTVLHNDTTYFRRLADFWKTVLAGYSSPSRQLFTILGYARRQ